MKKYLFKPKKLPVLTKEVAKKILRAASNGFEKVSITLDLGLSYSVASIVQDKVIIGRNFIRISDLEELVERDSYVYSVEKNKIHRISFFANGKFYKLKSLGENVSPTLEISGIHMHKIEGITPWRDSELKVLSIGVSKGDRVLDICTGLGYTAIISARRGASWVVSIEKDVNVLKIAEYNPWSSELERKEIEILLGDALEAITSFGDKSFDKVIHDPPRFSLAGELYSLDFYREIFRVLKPRGMMYHYVGSPGERYRGKSIIKGVSKRLKVIGFNVRIRRDLGGVIAYK